MLKKKGIYSDENVVKLSFVVKESTKSFNNVLISNATKILTLAQGFDAAKAFDRSLIFYVDKATKTRRLYIS